MYFTTTGVKKKSFVILRTSLYEPPLHRHSLYRRSTVLSSKTMSTINYWPRLRLNTFLDYDSVPDITKTSVQIKLTACCGTRLGTG